ncbi:MAG: hypothetical protein U0821_01895 [Chloroflexota bacterium]
MLLTLSTAVRAQDGDAGALTVPSDGGTAGPNYAAYAGRAEAINCLDIGSQADAQALLRADASDPRQLDSDRDGIACEANPEPLDLNPVTR